MGGLGMPWGCPWVAPVVILRAGGAHFSGLDGFGGIIGYPVGSKSDPGERLSRFGGSQGAKSEPKGDKNGAQKGEELENCIFQKPWFYLSKRMLFESKRVLEVSRGVENDVEVR